MNHAAVRERDAMAQEIERLRVDADCFNFWVHEAWNSPGDICRLLMNCESLLESQRNLLSEQLHFAQREIAQLHRVIESLNRQLQDTAYGELA